MKKFLLSIAAASLSMTALASSSLPVDFTKEFDPYQTAAQNLEGWSVYAPQGTPSGDYCKKFFPNYSPSNAIAVAVGSITGAWSVSEYSNGQESDTWLITPEINIPDNNEILVFTVEAIGMTSQVSNNFYVYISEGGVEKSDFTLLQSGTLRGSSSGADYLASTNKRFLLDGYAGKKVRLAFVNKGNKIGMMGFGNIYIGSWYADNLPSSAYFNNIMLGTNGDLAFSMRCSTPVTASSYTVDFKTSGGFEYTETVKKSIRLSSFTNISVNIPEINIGDEPETYTLTFTPDFEDARPAVFTGNILKAPASRNFDAVGVMEESTGAWCGWCPFGAAALDFYTDKYTGLDGTPKAIGIAIHDNDPMMISSSISDYYSEFMIRNDIDGFPCVTVNRLSNVTPSTNPTVVDTELKKVFQAKSYADAELTSVYYNPTESAEVWANFNLRTSINAPDGLFAVSAIITENNVQGKNSQYNQTSYLASNNFTAERIRSGLGEEWVPYFEVYFGKGSVPFRELQYQHVARGAFPSYEGKSLPAIFQGDIFEGHVHFDMPTNVLIKENTSVVILVRNTSTGEIVGADEMTFDEFTFESGVESVKEAAEVISTEYFTLDGRRLSNPEKGILIEVSRCSDGSILTKKVVR